MNVKKLNAEENKREPKKEGDIEMKFEFEAWIHPKNGGDDILTDGTIKASSMIEAKKELEYQLKKRSAVTNDYKITEAK